jgi:uncharacterized membrane protein YfcA
MSEQNLVPEPAFANAAAGSDATPALWNPTAAACWCLILSPVFGAFLHTQNWKALGNPERAAASRKWVVWGSIFLVGVILSSLIVPESRSLAALGRFGGFALLISWYYAIGKSQQTYVEERFGKNYTRRGWTIPIMSAIGIFVGIVVLLTLIALL